MRKQLSIRKTYMWCLLSSPVTLRLNEIQNETTATKSSLLKPCLKNALRAR